MSHQGKSPKYFKEAAIFQKQLAGLHHSSNSGTAPSTNLQLLASFDFMSSNDEERNIKSQTRYNLPVRKLLQIEHSEPDQLRVSLLEDRKSRWKSQISRQQIEQFLKYNDMPSDLLSHREIEAVR